MVFLNLLSRQTGMPEPPLPPPTDCRAFQGKLTDSGRLLVKFHPLTGVVSKLGPVARCSYLPPSRNYFIAHAP